MALFAQPAVGGGQAALIKFKAGKELKANLKDLDANRPA